MNKLTTLGNVNFYAFPDRASVIGGRILSENDLTAGWGGQINFAAVYPTGYACESAAGCSAYSLIYQDMPSEVCVALIPMVEGRSSRVRIRGAQNIVVKGNPLPGDTSPVAVYDPARMVEACNGADRVLVALISEK